MPFRGIRSSWRYSTRSGWIKNKIYKALPETVQKYGDFLMSKQLKVDDPTYAMLKNYPRNTP